MVAKNCLLNRLFTQNNLNFLLQGNKNPVFLAAAEQYVQNPFSKSNKEILIEIYQFMATAYRNEYFYQNNLLNILLLTKHNIQTTSALRQLPIGNAKADFVLINGEGIVYEIKSELDTFDRLDSQIEEYYKAFRKVIVVTGENNYEKLYSILKNKPVGMEILTSENILSSEKQKKPIDNNLKLDHYTIFRMLRKKEQENILRDFFTSLPNVPPVFYYDSCFDLFNKIPIVEAQEKALQELKKRNTISDALFCSIPDELKSLIYFFNPSVKQLKTFDVFLNKLFGE